jgi:hypothetical protein
VSEMIRKQIYISKRQEQQLKCLSKARGISEAEIMRNALERELHGEPVKQTPYHPQPSALAEFIQQALKQS